MGEASKNKFVAKDIECDTLTVNNSTTTTSINFVVSIDSFSTSSTKVSFTKNTLYLSNGIIENLGTATSTYVLST
jgi:hypothetical protein